MVKNDNALYEDKGLRVRVKDVKKSFYVQEKNSCPMPQCIELFKSLKDVKSLFFKFM